MSRAALRRAIPFDGGMLLVGSAERLLAYNGSAHQIWSALAEGHTPSSIATTLSEAFGVDPARMAVDVEAIVAHWRDEGVLDGSHPAPDTARDPDDSRAVEKISWAASWSCRFGTRLVEFAVEEPRIAAFLKESLQSLEVTGGTPEMRIEVRSAEDGTLIVQREGGPVRTASRSHGLKEAVYEALLEFLWPDRPVDTLIHAGAVARGGTAACFPATSGSGKSTLIAHLSGHGFEYLADDLTAIDRTLAVLPLPVPIRLKEGSWPLLDNIFPELQLSPAFAVGQTQARLVTPAASWDATPTRLGALIFPRYVAGSVADVQRLRPFDALVRLREAGVWFGYPLTDERVTRLARWLESTPAYALEYGPLRDAAAVVDEIIPK